MKILFVENRYCTRIWHAVGRQLLIHGHDVAYMIQNPVFAPKNAQCFLLPFPSTRHMTDRPDSEEKLSEKLRSDRAARYFLKSTRHYGHYMTEILKVVDSFRPDVIFGEPTQFHEILTIEIARKRNIPYLFPSSTRYPAGRTVFFKYDTMEPVGGEGVEMPWESASVLRQQIVKRESVPSYMLPTMTPKWMKISNKIKDRIKISAGWLLGERFITPSPLTKILVEKRQSKLVEEWEKTALPSLPKDFNNGTFVLYAMQMQPESNIDVWGYPWNDQTDLIIRAAAALEKVGGTLVIKPNPKSKYEITSELIRKLSRIQNVLVLSHKSKMDNVFPAVQGVLSVTGTVILECVLSQKPVAVLGDHELAKLPGVTNISAPEDVSKLVVQIRAGTEKRATEADGIGVLQQLYKDSYPGVMYDALNQSDMAATENVKNIVSAFDAVLVHVVKND
jgi:hypothetical protein